MASEATSRNQTFDEETPLIPQPTKKTTPLPWTQLSILLCLQLIEPLTAQIINPFISEVVRGTGIIEGDRTQTGYYVGLLQSAFFAAQTITILRWSRVSDQIGRRPVLMIGAIGIAISMIMFALSSSYSSLVSSRSLTGALNGYIGVVKGMMAEVTDSSNAAQAFAYMPIAWATGATLGPLLGGQLSHPVERFPSLFGGNKFMTSHPYLVALSVPALMATITTVVIYRFLKETAPGKVALSNEKAAERPEPMRSIRTRPVIIATINYAMLSLVDISFRSVRPTFFASPIGAGGLALTPPTMGALLAAGGFTNALFQAILFPKILARFGTKRLFLLAVPMSLPAISIFPLMAFLAERNGGACGAVWVAYAIQVACFVTFNMTAGCIFVIILEAAPDRRSIGAVNSVAQMAVSVTRTVGPSFVNTLFSMSLKNKVLGGHFVWLMMACMVCLLFLTGLLIPSKSSKYHDDDQ